MEKAQHRLDFFDSLKPPSERTAVFSCCFVLYDSPLRMAAMSSWMQMDWCWIPWGHRDWV